MLTLVWKDLQNHQAITMDMGVVMQGPSGHDWGASPYICVENAWERYCKHVIYPIYGVTLHPGYRTPKIWVKAHGEVGWICMAISLTSQITIIYQI